MMKNEESLRERNNRCNKFVLRLSDKREVRVGLFDLLSSLELRNNITQCLYIPSLENLSKLFMNCSKLESCCDIPEGVKYSDYMFCGCTNLKKIGTIPNSLISCESMFENCWKLKMKVNIGNNVVNSTNMYKHTLVDNTQQYSANFTEEETVIMKQNVKYLRQLGVDLDVKRMERIVKHCRKYKVKPIIQEYFECLEHYYDEMYKRGIPREQARLIFEHNKNEYQLLYGYGVIKYAV